MFLDILSFSEFLGILQYSFEKILTFTSGVITQLMNNNIIKYIVMLCIASFIISILLEIRDFIPRFLLMKKLENSDREFDGVTYQEVEVTTPTVRNVYSVKTSSWGHKKNWKFRK